MTTEEQLALIAERMDIMVNQLFAVGDADEQGITPAYNVAEGLVMIAEAIDRNTAAITALKAELETAQLQNRQ